MSEKTIAQEVAAGAGVRRLRFLVILGSLSGFGPLSIDMYLAGFPAIAVDLHASAAQVQLSLTAFTFGLAAGQLFAGPLSDHFGRRPPLLVGLSVYVLASVLCAFAPTAYSLAALRLAQGLGGAAALVIARAVVRDLYSGVAMARFFSMIMLVTGLAPILAPVVGGQLLRVLPWRGIFGVLALLGVVLLVTVVLALPETLAPERRGAGTVGRALRTFGALLADRTFLGYALSAALAFSALFAYVSGSSFVLQNAFGLSPQLFTLVFAVNSVGIMVTAQVAARLIGRFGSRRLLAVGLCVTAVGAVLVLLAASTGLGLPALLPALFLVASSIGLVLPNATALAMSGHPETAGSASALFGVLQFTLGGIAAPLVGIAGTSSAIPMGTVMAVAALAGVTVFAVLTRRRPA